MAAGDPGLRLDGSEGTMVLIIGKTPVAESKVQWESGDVAEKATMHEDKLMGADRDQHDKRVRGYTFRGTFFVANTAIVDAIETRDAQKRARVPVKPMSIQYLLTLRDGTFRGFTLTGSVEAKWNFGMPGSDARMKVTVDGMASEKVPATV